MAIDTKISFINRLEKKLEYVLTVKDMNAAMKAALETLEHYEMFERTEENPETDDLLQCYLAAIRVEGRSRKTVDRYTWVLGHLIRDSGVSVRNITVYHIRGWIAREAARGIQDSTLKGYREIFSAFFNWLHRENLIERNPMANIGPIKCKKKKRKPLSDVEMEKLCMNCSETKYPLRNRAIVEFLKATGCRISEVTELDRGQVDLQKLEVTVLGKGNKERKVYLTPVAGMVLKDYLDSREDENPALFTGRRKERLQPCGIRAMLNKLAEAAGVENVHPHRFRRTLATNMNRRGMPVEEVAAILGHEKLDTTMKYVALNDDDIKNAYRRYV